MELVTGPGDTADDGEGAADSGLTGSELARAALAAAQRRGSAVAPGPSRDARRRAANRRANLRGTVQYSGSGPDRRDPQPLSAVQAKLFAEMGWERPMAQTRLFTEWESLVGQDIAARCQPTGLREGELKVAAESSAWATQLRLMSAAILARLHKELGSGIVEKLVVTGPVAPSWKHGPWSVRGHRGPRDTYG